ncbi:dockerin [Sorangium cellulosum]|uniref:dockerin n=1 Tax=Sorangium cellulosum TaxID=56 RepID=UPI003D9A8D96
MRATTQRHHNLKLSLGSVSVPPFNPNAGGLSMVPLVEPIRPLATGYPSAYPRNMYGESPHTAMGDQITTLAQASTGRDYISVHTVVGESGQAMSVIRKGASDTGTTGRAYAASLFETAAIARLAGAQGKKYGVGAIVITHGESDAGSASYKNDLIRLWTDYNTDVKPLTGQTQSIPMFVSQQHAYPTGSNQRSASTLAQWQVGVDRPGEIICSGPKYQYPYASDNIHMTVDGYERLGEKLGQIYHEKVVQGRDWRPLEPTRVERSGRVITVHFHVPVPPLAWDNTLPAPHQGALTEWSQGKGFEVRTGSSRIRINSVEISGSSVRITVGSDLPATGVFVGYAMTSDGTAFAGRTWRSGQLRDSDPFVGSMTRVAQPNYAVAFEMPVP